MSKRARQPETSPDATVAALLGCLIVIAALAVHVPAMSAGFIWDDDSFLTANPLIKDASGLRKFWFTTKAEDYFPLTYSMLWFEYHVWRENAPGYHVINILLHAGAALLLWRVLKRLGVPAAWLGGLLFAIHPVAVSSVAWITERKNTLSMVFYLASLLTYLRFDESGRRKHYALALLWFLLALFSKSSVVVLPAALLLCTWWRRGKIGWADARRVAPFVVLGIVFGLAQIHFHDVKLTGHPPLVEGAETSNYILKGTTGRPEGFASRLAASGWAAWFYLYKAVLPIRLMMAYPRWDVDPAKWVVWIPLAALAGAFLLLWRYRKRWGRAPLFALAYFVAALGPVLGFFEISFMEYTLVADHWQYIALPGVLGLAAGLAGWGWRRLPGWRGQIGTVAALAVIALGVLGYRHAAVYDGQESLWRHNLKYNPNFAPGHTNLGNMLLAKGNFEGAIAEYEKSIAINPDFPLPYFNLGSVNFMFAQNQKGLSVEQRRALLDKAIMYYNKRMDLLPDKETKYYLDEALKARARLGGTP
jgi:hypothetical protein